MSSSDGSDSPGSARRQSRPSAHSPTMRGWHLGNEAAARRTAALQVAHRSQRLEIVHYIDDTYGKAAVPFKDVAEHFHRSQGTMTGLWKGRHDLEPRRPGPHPAPVDPPRPEDDLLVDVVFHPPRKDAPTDAGRIPPSHRAPPYSPLYWSASTGP